ncbi:MAG: DUF4143 domain-containing protein [Coprobacillus sp.]|nr:DUF4143 domain-containing protein [Coprobacillus sp.]
MLKREFYDYLVKWKESKDEECLLVKGAPRVGKTYIIDYFGKTNYKTYLYLNFKSHPEYKKIFNGDLSASEIYTRIGLSLNISLDKLVDKNTLIFLDEIGECPNARTALKFLALDNRYDVIASGNFLNINTNGITSIPVGYEKTVELYSLSFKEFLWANGISSEETDKLKASPEKKKQIDKASLKEISTLFSLYMVIGGLPEVINTYLKTRDLVKVHTRQEKIISRYLEEIDKCALSSSLKKKMKDCFFSIPLQLNRPYKKFHYKEVNKKGKSEMYGTALYYLKESELVNFSYNVSKPEIPLLAYKKNNEFKVYFNDTGLLTCMLGLETQRLLYYNELKGNARGGIYENIIAETLTKNGYPLYYFKKTSSEQEIEFLIEKYMSIVPIEVKSNSGKATSLKAYIEEFKPTYAYKLVEGSPNYGEDKTTLPLFMAIYL